MKIFLFGFDGLRPDCVTAQSMPRLHAFLNENVVFADNRSVFPSETYVNHPSIYTGFLPQRHGLVANAFFERAWSRKDFFVGNSVEKIEAVEKATVGMLYEVPALADILAGNGRSFVSVSSNSSGSTRLMAHKAAKTGNVNISTCGLRYALPEELRGRFGTDPADGKYPRPDIPGLKKMNEIVHYLFSTNGIPDVSLIWYGEPDNTFHAYGIGSPQSYAVLKAADDCFAEIVDTYADSDTCIFVLSDHGHVTVKEHFDVNAALEERGFSYLPRELPENEDFTSLWGYSGNIYVREPSLIVPVIRALQEMPQIGLLFTRDRDGVHGIADGTFSQRLVGGDHHRAGDIRYVLRTTDEKNTAGFPGLCYCPPGIDVGSSIHGGLHEKEMHALLGMGGPGFRKATVFNTPTSVIDIAPTIHALLGITPPIPPQGRVLHEAFVSSSGTVPATPDLASFETGEGSYRQKIRLYDMGGIPYVVSGERTQ